MNAKIKGMIVLLIIVSSFGAGYQVNDWIYKERELEALRDQVKADKELRDSLFLIAKETQESISNIRIENTTIYRKTEREILKEPVYTECFLTEEGLKLVNKARGYDK